MMKQMIQINSPDSRGNWFVTVRAKVITELRVELNETKAALEREQQDCAALRQMVRELRDALAECREDSVELLGEWAWKRGTIPRNDRAIEELEGRISIADSIIAAWPIELLNNK